MSKRKKIMITERDLALLAFKVAQNRFSDAAIVIAENVAFGVKPPTEAEQEEYRAASIALVRAHRECAKAIEKELTKEVDRDE